MRRRIHPVTVSRLAALEQVGWLSGGHVKGTTITSHGNVVGNGGNKVRIADKEDKT